MNNKQYSEQEVFNQKMGMVEELYRKRLEYLEKANQCRQYDNYIEVSLYAIRVQTIDECIALITPN